MLLQIELDDLSKILEALYQSEQIDLIEKLKIDAQNILFGQNEGIEHLFAITENYIQMKQEKKINSFKDFSLEDCIVKFDLEQIRGKLFKETDLMQPNEWLIETLDMASHRKLKNEKERSESLIHPVLSALQKMNDYQFGFFSGESFVVDEENGLKGELDFVFVENPKTDVLNAPLFGIVEAKQGDITKHWGQAVAQMLAAQKFNLEKGKPIKTIYSCVTTGEDWHFLTLENQLVVIDERPYSIYTELEKILGIFQYIVDFYKENKDESIVSKSNISSHI